MRVIVTGSRDWGYADLVSQALSGVLWTCVTMEAPMVLVHGGCPSGADRAAAHWYSERKDRAPRLSMEVFVADWSKDGRAAGPLRNIRMFDEPVDLVLAFWDGHSRGTQHTIQLATQKKVPLLIRGSYGYRSKDSG